MSALDTIPSSGSAAGFRLRLAEGLWRAAMAALALMPVGMAVAHRSSPAFLVLGALLALAAVAAEGKLQEFRLKVSKALASPLGLAILAFFGWCLVSIAWSEFKGLSLRAMGEFWLPAASAFVLCLTLPQRMTRAAFLLLAGAFVAACCMIMLELGTGLTLRHALGRRSDTFIFNRPVLTLLVFTPALAVWLSGRSRHGWALALGLVALLTVTALVSDSGAAVLGLVTACFVFPVAWFAPRAARGIAAGAFLAAVAVAPFIGSMGGTLIPASFHERMAQGHSRERVDLWTSFGAAVREQPVLGAGFGVSPRMAETDVAKKVPASQQRMLAIGHPHNAALQIWVELGAVGSILALAIVFLVLRLIARQPHIIGSASLALLAGAAAVALVGHGAWQGWWAASLGAAIIWMSATDRMRPENRA